MKDESIDYMLDRCHDMKHLQLYAANLVSDDAWNRLFRQAGSKLEVVKLSWLDAAFDDTSVQELVQGCPNLRRLKLKLCRRIGEDAVSSISEIPHLEHLSLLMNKQVNNDILENLIHKRGSALRTLSLEKFMDADDRILAAIHDSCRQLSKLRLTENDTATDAAFAALFQEWSNPPLTFIDFNSNRDIDNNNPDGPEQAVGLSSAGFKAMMAHSGPGLKHLDISSCRHIELSAFMDVFNGAQNYPTLEYINVSFCNRIENTVIAGIFRSCPNLKQLVAFGCFDIQDIVVPRNITLIGVPRAQDAIEQYGVGIDVDEALSRMVEVGA
jgi:DNA repair protein RAD7